MSIFTKFTLRKFHFFLKIHILKISFFNIFSQNSHFQNIFFFHKIHKFKYTRPSLSSRLDKFDFSKFEGSIWTFLAAKSICYLVKAKNHSTVSLSWTLISSRFSRSRGLELSEGRVYFVIHLFCLSRSRRPTLPDGKAQ